MNIQMKFLNLPKAPSPSSCMNLTLARGNSRARSCCCFGRRALSSTVFAFGEGCLGDLNFLRIQSTIIKKRNTAPPITVATRMYTNVLSPERIKGILISNVSNL